MLSEGLEPKGPIGAWAAIGLRAWGLTGIDLCNSEGTELCHHINGSCTCKSGWKGGECQMKVVPPTSPPFPGAAVGAVLAVLLILVILVVVIVAMVIRWRKKRGKADIARIHPEDETASFELKRVGQGEGLEEEDGLNITRTESLKVIIPKGSRLQDMFVSKEGGEEEGTFNEPHEINHKLRWQVVHIYKSMAEATPTSKDTPTAEATPTGKDTSAHSRSSRTEEGASTKEVDTPPTKAATPTSLVGIEKKVYSCGVYLEETATLKDLRALFIDSNQADPNDRIFLFLVAMDSEDTYAVDDEDRFCLKDFELTQREKRTFYIKTVERTGLVMKDLCVCGRVSEWECAKCEEVGYCSETCQEEDWPNHKSFCRDIRRKRKEMKRRLKEEQKRSLALRSLDTDLCTCGMLAVYECSGCGRHGYCSTTCQQADWKIHQYECKSGL